MLRFLRDHLNDTGVTYWQHFRRSLSLSFLSAIASVVLLFHAFFPFLFVTSGSTIITKIGKCMDLGSD
jgi:hypothetical protein